MPPIKIFGHKAPDTDATCSAVIWAWYQTQQNQPATPYVLGIPNTEAAFVLQHWNHKTPAILPALNETDRVIIVDTNNPAELPADITTAQIIQIIDHHLLAGGLQTNQPIPVTIAPLASTATIMAGMMGDALATAPDDIKGLILSCILSDTLEFRSPTTTPTDIALAKQMADDLNINIPDYAAQMFAAKSDVSHMTDAELLRLDSKEYPLGDLKLRISVIETTTPDSIIARKSALMSAMPSIAEQDGVAHVLFFIVDILNETAILLIQNPVIAQIAKASFNIKPDGDTGGDMVILPGIVSRKKQIIPNLRLE